MGVGECRSSGPARLARYSVVLAILLTAACASHSAQHPAGAPASPTGTVVRPFHAYDAHGQLAVRVEDITTGNCWTTSIADPVPHAYRCLAGNTIYDPCFAPASGQVTQVACMSAPWADAEVLQLSGKLPAASAAPGTHRPWAFVLAGGIRCVAATGTVPEVAGVNLGYECGDGSNATLVDPSAKQVVAQRAAPGATTLTRVLVTTIWPG